MSLSRSTAVFFTITIRNLLDRRLFRRVHWTLRAWLEFPTLGLLRCIATSILAPVAPALAQEPAPITWEPMTLRAFDGRTTEAQAGKIEVPERREVPGGPGIALGFLRLPSTAQMPGPPTFFLMGGPGVPGSVMGQVPPYYTLFEKLRALGDVILLDQRGIGRSSPVLECPPDGSLPANVFSTHERLVAELRRRVGTCASTWRSRGVDASAYTTNASADDIEDIRRALGAPSINLLSFSYGTRLALAVIQRHGSHVSRAVLASVNGPGHVIKLPAAAERRLQQFSSMLAADTGWHAASDLVSTARRARARLAGTPATLSIGNRQTGSSTTVTVGEEGFLALVSLHTEDSRLPALLITVAEGDYDVLTRIVEADWNGLGLSPAGLMARAINCSADRPAERLGRARSEGELTALGEAFDNAVLSDDFCRVVGFKETTTEFGGPVVSQIPALFLTGTLDAITPSENAEEVLKGFPHGVALQIQNGHHETLPIESVQDAVVRFFRGEDVSGLVLATFPPRFMSIEQAKRPPQRR